MGSGQTFRPRDAERSREGEGPPSPHGTTITGSPRSWKAVSTHYPALERRPWVPGTQARKGGQEAPPFSVLPPLPLGFQMPMFGGAELPGQGIRIRI